MNQRPTIYNLTLTNAGTEYSQALPANTKKVQIKGRGNVGADIKLAFAADGTTSGPYMTIPAGGQHSMDMVYLNGTTIYLNGTISGEVAEILVWK